MSSHEELERMMDQDGRQFLEALVMLEHEVEDMRRQNDKLIEERTQKKGAVSEAQDAYAKKEKEVEDMRHECVVFREEKDEDLRVAQDEFNAVYQQLAQRHQEFERKLSEVEGQRDHVLEAMTDEGQQLQARIEQLNQDKEVLNHELVRTQARADAAAAEAAAAAIAGTSRSRPARSIGATSSDKGENGGAVVEAEAGRQLRAVVGEQKSLKDEVSNREEQLTILRSQVDVIERKLKNTDMETAD